MMIVNKEGKKIMREENWAYVIIIQTRDNLWRSSPLPVRLNPLAKINTVLDQP